MLASHCITSGQGWPMKLNGGTRPLSSSLTSNSRGSGTRGGFSGRLTLGSSSFFLSLSSPSFFLSSPSFFSSGLASAAFGGGAPAFPRASIIALICSGDGWPWTRTASCTSGQ